jgi:hypothetical protein
LTAPLAAAALAQARKPLQFIPLSNLTSIDPIWTTAVATYNRAGFVAILSSRSGRGIVRGGCDGCGRVVQGKDFKGQQFAAEVILWAVRWHLMFPISYRDLEPMLLDRGVEVDHTTKFRWIQAHAAELEKRVRPHLRLSNGSWRVDETYIRVRAVGLPRGGQLRPDDRLFALG